MATQTVQLHIQSADKAEHERVKAMLLKMNLPAVPVFNDVLFTVDLSFSAPLTT